MYKTILLNITPISIEEIKLLDSERSVTVLVIHIIFSGLKL